MTDHNATPMCHLSEDQVGEMLAGVPAEAQGDAHVLACDTCAAELAAIRDSLSLFRDATRAYADTELRRLPPMTMPSRRLISPALQPAWWVAAAALLLTAVLPTQMLRQHHLRLTAVAGSSTTTAATSSSGSDEALLEDVDREASASLPSPMQALDNPTPFLTQPTPLASQRKD